MLLFAPGDATATPSSGLTTLPGPVAMMARLRGGRDGGAGLWWWSGRVYGRRPDEIARPLLQVTGIGWSRFTPAADGSWRFAMSEAGFFADFDSGEFLAEWTNPYTGKRLAPPPNRLQLGYRVSADGVIAAPFPGMSFDGRIGPVAQQGGQVWVGERLMANLPPPPPGQPAKGPSGNAVEFSNFLARLDDLLAPADQFCPATMHHQAAWGLYPWLEMPGERGDILTDIVGRKVASASELPAALQARVAAVYPGLLTDPGI
jgi:hypothetical protein